MNKSSNFWSFIILFEMPRKNSYTGFESDIFLGLSVSHLGAYETGSAWLGNSGSRLGTTENCVPRSGYKQDSRRICISRSSTHETCDDRSRNRGFWFGSIRKQRCLIGIQTNRISDNKTAISKKKKDQALVFKKCHIWKKSVLLSWTTQSL